MMLKTLRSQTAIALGSCLVLAGCPLLYYEQCDGFSASNVESWSMDNDINIGDSLEFVDDSGAPVGLTLVSRRDSEPHRTILRKKYELDQVPCKNSSVRRYEIEDADTVLRITLWNVERFRGQSPDDQWLTMSVRPENRDGVPDGNQFTFPVLNSPESYYSSDFQEFEPTLSNPLKTRYLVSSTIGSERVPYAIEQIHVYPEDISLNDEGLAVRRLMIAKGIGVAQFELYNGRVFTHASLAD